MKQYLFVLILVIIFLIIFGCKYHLIPEKYSRSDIQQLRKERRQIRKERSRREQARRESQRRLKSHQRLQLERRRKARRLHKHGFDTITMDNISIGDLGHIGDMNIPVYINDLKFRDVNVGQNIKSFFTGKIDDTSLVVYDDAFLREPPPTDIRKDDVDTYWGRKRHLDLWSVDFITEGKAEEEAEPGIYSTVD